MNGDMKAVLVVFKDKEKLSIVNEVLAEQAYRVVMASNSNETRLKFSNENFVMVIMDMDIPGIHAQEFVDGIRRKESLRNINRNIPVLIVSANSVDFSEQFTHFENVKFLPSDFDKMEFKKKLLTFSGNSNVISENTRKIEEGEYLITEGGTGTELFWVLSGQFVITKLNHDNQNVILGEVFPGELVGEMSFLDNLPRSASVRATMESEVLVIPHRKFIDVLDHQPRWFRSLIQTLSQRLRKADLKISQKFVQVDDDKPKLSEED